MKVINATWSLVHKYRSLMRLHDNSAESNHRIVNDNFNLKVSLLYAFKNI